MRNSYSIFALAALLLLPAGMIVAADAPSPANDSQANVTDAAEPANAAAEAPAPEPMDVAETFDEFVGQYPDEQYLTINDAPYEPWLATRFGWWGLSTSGSPYGVGEWQGLNTATPFWDVDGITSDGARTIDFFATGPEDEANQAGLYVYGGPGLSMDLDYNRFIHRLGHDPYGGLPDANGFPPLGGFYNPPLNANVAGNPMWGQDLNVGQDYALRVQQLKVNFKGNLTENLSWGLNVWEMRKEGMRQTNSVTHCYDARRGLDALLATTADNNPAANSGTCHLVSKGQNIDWLTMEIEPVITARFGWLTLEYSRTMRSFQQGDDLVTFRHTRNPSLGYGEYTVANPIEPAYAYASENFTEIDRLKVLADVAPDTDLYVLGFVGNTHNTFRESDRKFYGVDARVTNSTYDGLTTTIYGKTFAQNNSADTTALNTRYPTQTLTWVEPVPPQTNISAASPPALLVDRYTAAVGLKGRWRPFYDSCGWTSRMAVVGGYEYRELERQNVTYVIPDPAGTFTQPDTATNMVFVGVQQDLTCTLSSYVRYRMIANDYPLVGVTPGTEDPASPKVQNFNSMLPEHEDRIEIGGDWNPTESLLLNASFWIQNSYNHSELVNFDEDSYPIVISACYTPDDRWAFTGGYATFSNWIDQDITLSNDNPFTNEWNYTGRADVFNLGARFAWTCRTTLTGGVEYVRSRNVFADPPDPNGVAYDPLAVYSAVRVDTWRFTAGADYRLTDNMNTYLRYNYFDYEDAATGWNTGTAHMFLAGLSGVF